MTSEITIPTGACLGYRTEVGIEFVTPETAEEWLGRNERNRHLRASRVVGLARAMSLGLWEFNGAAIRFDTKGRLLDGQHRLHAVAESRVPIWVVVVRGLDPEVQNTVDVRARRTVSDQLQRDGLDDAKRRAAVARLLIEWECRSEGAKTLERRATDAEVNARARSEEVAAATAAARRYRRLPISPALAALLWHLCEKAAPGCADAFFSAVVDGETQPEGSPQRSLWKRLWANDAQPTREAQIAYFWRAWSAFRTGRSLSVLLPAELRECFPVADGARRPARSDRAVSPNDAPVEARTPPRRDPSWEVAIEEVTPAIASEWLLRNTGNRQVRQGHLDGMVRTMESGGWTFNGDSVCFDGRGVMIDGQHRMRAVVQSGVTIRTVVVRGLDPHAQDTIDIGAEREVGDQLQLLGIKSAQTRAAVAGLLVRWEGMSRTASTLRSYQATRPEILSRALADDAELATVAAQLFRHTRATPSVVGLAWHLCCESGPGDVDRFFEGLNTGADLPKGSPILKLRNQFEQLRAQRWSKPPTTELQLRYIWLAWDAFRSGRQLASWRLVPLDRCFPGPRR